MQKIHNHMKAMGKHWLCDSCGFRMPAAPGEEEPKHCPRCYKSRNAVKELKKIPAQH